jgi:Tc toxin complex TcA C-terminal TcB-binding domain/Neuraminidase-like domain/PA14 domain/Salmonella virulence plasmid 28.1kDa A protein
MNNPVSIHLGEVNLSDTVLNNLKAGAPAQAFINDTLNNALTSSLAGAATSAGYANLATLISAVPSVDIAANKDLSIHDFVSKEIKLPDDPTARVVAESAIAKLSATTTIGELLGLEQPVNANPLLAGLVGHVNLATLLQTSATLTANATVINDFIASYATFQGSMTAFWAALSQNAEFTAVVPELQLTLQLGTLTLGSPSLVAALRAQFPQMTSPGALATMSATDWEQLITSQHVIIPASIAGATPTEQTSTYASTIASSLAAAFPGPSFGNALQSALAASEKSVDKGVATFLSKASEFDILNTNLSTYIAQQGTTVFAGVASTDQGAITEQLATWQRVARVTSDFPTANSLLTAGYASAYRIASTPRASFLQTMGGTLASTSAAEVIYGRAQQISGTAMALFTNVRQALTGATLRAIGDVSGSVAQALSAPSGIPSWQTLFGSLSSCTCKDCRSVYSAAAYFVDLLQFLANSSKNSSGQTPLDALLVRRPDLQFIKLNCVNTNTEMPYVDLVNEIMESFVVYQGGPKTLSSTTAHDTPKGATAADLSVSPAYTLDAAYNPPCLSAALFPPSLPFDRWLLTARTYLGFLGSSLYEVMETCQTGAEPTTYSVPLSALPNIVIPAFATYNLAAHTLSVTAAMTADDETALLALSSDAGYTAAVTALYAASQAAGSAGYTVPLAALPNIGIPPFVTYNSTAHTLSVAGAMTADAETALLALSSDAGYTAAVTALYAASQADAATGTPSRIAIACEYLKISNVECLILTSQDFFGHSPAPASAPPRYQYYGYEGTTTGSNVTFIPPLPVNTTWEQDIAGVNNPIGVENFLQRTAIAYADLVALLKTRALNPMMSMMLQASGTDPCNLSETIIVDLSTSGGVLQDVTLDRLHRFIRLWKKLGWTIIDLDKTMTALGATLIDQGFIIELAGIQQLMTATGLPLLQVLSFWATIDTDGRDSLYLSLFQNRAVLNPPDASFQLTYVAPLAALPLLQLPSPLFPNLSFVGAFGTGWLMLQGTFSDVEYDQLKVLSSDPGFLNAIGSLHTQGAPSPVFPALPVVTTLPSNLLGLPNLLYNPSSTPHQISFLGAMPDDYRDQFNFSSDPAYQTAIDAIYEMRTLFGVQLAPGPTISSNSYQIQAALGINTQDLAALCTYAGLTDPTTPLTLASLSTLTRYAFLAQGLSLSVGDLLTAIALIGTDPFVSESPTATLAFVVTVQTIQASPFTIAQLNYLYLNMYDPNAGVAPAASDISSLLTTLQAGLAGIANANASVPDPKGTLLTKALAAVLGTTLANAAMGLINGTGVYSASLAAMPSIVLPAFVSYNGATQTLSIVGAMTAAQESQLFALSTDPTYQAAVASLYQASQVGGVTTYTQSLAVLPASGLNVPPPPIILPAFVPYNGSTQTLSIVGAMTAAQESQLLALSTDPTYQAAVASLYQASQAGGVTTYTQLLAILPTAPPPRIVYDSASQMLRITGPMTDAEESALLTLSSDTAYNAAVQNLHQQPIDFINNYLVTLLINNTPSTFLNSSDAIKQLIENPSNLDVAEKVAYVAAGLMPCLTQIQSVSLIKQTLSDNLSLNPQLCDLLLNTILHSQITQPPATAPAMFDYLALLGDGLTASYYKTVDLSGSPVATRVDSSVNFNWGFGLANVAVTSRPFSVRWTGFVIPQYSETYTFYVQAGDGVRLWVNGVLLLPPNSWTDGLPTERSGTIALNAGQLYAIELDYYDHTASAVVALSWSSPSNPKAIIPQSQLFSGAKFSALTPIVNSYILLFKSSLLIKSFSLTFADVAYVYQKSGTFGGVDPNNPSAAPVPFDPNVLFDATSFTPAVFNEWQRLNAIVSLRNTLPGGDVGLLNIFTTASASTTNTPGTLSAAVSAAVVQATNWNAVDLTSLASSSEFGLSDADFTNELGTQGNGLVRLQSCVELLGRLGVSAQQLFVWSAFGTDEETTAKAIQNAVKAKYDDATWVTVGKPLNDTIREASKEALIAYILANAAIWNMKAADDGGPITLSDQLYEYFLIDVDMSPCMLTSRIVQASAAVQLFVQRCLLNLEIGVSPAVIDPVQWSWMQNFRVWQANRMVLLYPENWIVPTLRDDQTPLFQTFANELLQNPITQENVEQAYLDYLNSLNTIARLDMRASYWQLDPTSVPAPDGTPDATNDVLHVFGRTTTQPYAYYYRRLLHCSQFGVPGGGSAWTAWEPVGASIEGDHLIPVVWDGRLFLFWPVFAQTADPRSQDPVQPQGILGTIGTAPPALPIQDLTITLNWSEYQQGAWSSKQSSNPWKFLKFTKWAQEAFDASQFSFNSSFTGGDSLVINILYNFDSESTSGNQSVSTLFSLGSFVFSSCGSAPPAQIVAFLLGGPPVYPQIPGNGNSSLSLSTSYDFLEAELGTDLLGLRVGYVPVPPMPTTGPADYGLIVEILSKAPNDLRLMFPQQYFESFGLIVPPSFPQPPAFGSNGQTPGEPFFYEDSDRVYFITESFSYQTFRDATAESSIYGRVTLTSTSSQVATAVVFPQTDEDSVAGSVATAPTTTVPTVQPKTGLTLSQILFSNHFHPFSCTFIKELNRYGLPKLLTLANQELSNDGRGILAINAFSGTYDPTSVVGRPWPLEQVDFSPTGAYSIYNWELFFHIPVLIATQLDQNQQFDDAETWWRYIFNPTTSSTDSIPQRYWQFLPFYQSSPSDSVNAQIQDIFYPPASGGALDQISAWKEDPFNPFVIARMRPVAFRMYVIMQYIQHHLSYGDYLFAQNSRESINEATLHYVLAKELLGPPPVQNPARGKSQDYTYNDLANFFGIDALSNSLVSLENDFPYLSTTAAPAGSGLGPTLSMSSSAPYFCFPPNDTLTGLWSTVDDRLYKIRRCMNIQGVVEQQPLFSPPISPALLVAAEAAGVSLSSILSNTNAGSPFYRFAVMIQKALDLCAEVRAFGASLLAALEKQDAEELELLRATQESNLLQAMQQMKQSTVQAAQADVAALQAGLQVTKDRQQYYSGLIQQAQTYQENQQAKMLAQSGQNLVMAKWTQSSAAALGVTPGCVTGGAGPSSPVLLGELISAAALVAAASALGSYFSGEAADSANQASQNALQAEWGRRAQEWAFQLQSATGEIDQINSQISASQFRLAVAQEDQSNLNLQIQNAQAVQSFLQSKYTNTALYSWMVGQISTVFFQCYQMAYDLATQAEVGFRFERGLTTSSYIQFGYWDSLKKGLLSGERLYADLKRMELAYLQTDVREYEITKAVSLVLFDPWALITLKTTGQCVVNLPEALFDHDYPGHYFRRVKTVSLAIPCVTGPYTSVNCTLTMLNSKTRIDNIASSKTDFANDAHFITNYAASQSIATSTALNDPGLFEVNFRDERYLPFEGAGVISTWQIDLPIDCNAFDFESISDVLINLRYTSRYGGDGLRDLARQTALLPTRAGQTNPGKPMPFATPQKDLQRLFSLKREFPTEWYKFLNPPDTATSQSMSIALGNERFPFQYRKEKFQFTEVELFLVFKGSQFQTDYSSGGSPTALVLHLGTLGISNPPSATLISNPPILGGLPYDSIVPPKAAGSGPPTWILSADNADIAKIHHALQNVVSTGGANYTHLNPNAISDIYLLCHYSVS